MIAAGFAEPEPKPQIAPAEPAPAPAQAAPPAPPAAPALAPVLEPDDRVERAARMAARETADLMRVEPPVPASSTPPAGPAFELTPEDQRDYNILLFIARQEEQHAGLPQRFLDYVKKVYDYQTKWLAEHPNEQFDSEAEGHAGWYAANPPPVTTDQLSEWEDDMRVERKLEARLKNDPRLQKIDMIEQRDRLESAMPTIHRNINRTILQMVESANPELAKLLRDEQGNPNFSEATILAVETADPISKDELDRAVREELEPLIIELEKTGVDGLNYKLNPQANARHAIIDRYKQQAERDLAGTTFEDGKRFISIDEMNARRSEITNGPGSQPERQRKLEQLFRDYRTLSIDDLEEIIADDVASRARVRIDRFKAVAKKQFGQNGGNGAGTPAPATAPPTAAPAGAPVSAPPVAPPNAPNKPRPPSMPSGADVVTNPNPTAPNSKTFGQTATDIAFK